MDAPSDSEIARLSEERDFAQQQIAATAEVLRIIASSPGELGPVFNAVLENAVRICGAKFGNLWLYDGDVLELAAMHGAPLAYRERLDRTKRLRAGPGSGLAVVLQTREVVQIADLAATKGYLDGEPLVTASVELGGTRALIDVPMLKDGNLIGVIAIFRQEAKPFTDRQIELVQNFAAQAVIAIENTRLLNELRQRTDGLTESLEQQTATSEVLKVISSSPGELEPVFKAMLASSVQLCDAGFGTLNLYENGSYRTVALHNVPPAYSKIREASPIIHADPGSSLDRVARTKEVVQVDDVRTTQPYLQGKPAVTMLANVAGARTLLTVPMLKDNELVGTIGIYRQQVRPFTDKQIELVQNFAAQAVIAIENTRLLNELRRRTDDLTESLEQQTATSEVLRVISSSPGDLEPVFQTLLGNATQLCEAKFGVLWLCDGGLFRAVAAHGAPPAYRELLFREAIRPGPDTGLGMLTRSKRFVQIEDITKGQAYIDRDPLRVATVEVAGGRTLAEVPLLKDDELIGSINIYRQEVRPFTDKQIELLTNFAAQAVIAIENTRLLNELRQRTTELEQSYGTVRQQANQLEAQSEELRTLNQQLEGRVAEQVGEIERMGRLRRFLPPQVADLIVSQGAEKQLESHRREITALFCDLRGFTGFSESSDPEDVMLLLRDYHNLIGRIIFKHGGTLERFAGDGVMVIFNDPVPLPNPALSAVKMALEMREAIGALVEKWKRLGHDLGFGIGIAHGYATLGTIGFEGRFDYAAIGTVSNVASRLCDEAKPGQILVAPRVLLAVEDAVTVEPAGELTLKGIRRPMLVHNVLNVMAANSAAASAPSAR